MKELGYQEPGCKITYIDDLDVSTNAYASK